MEKKSEQMTSDKLLRAVAHKYGLSNTRYSMTQMPSLIVIL